MDTSMVKVMDQAPYGYDEYGGEGESEMSDMSDFSN